MDSEENPKKLDEPSLLDYVIARIKFWEKSSLINPDISNDDNILNSSTKIDMSEIETGEVPLSKNSIMIMNKLKRRFPWSFCTAVLLAIVAQILLEPSAERSAIPGILLYIFAGVALIISLIRREVPVVPYKADELNHARNLIRTKTLVIGLLFEVVAFILFSSNQFTFINISLWISGLILIIGAIWNKTGNAANFVRNIYRSLKQPSWNIKLTRWTFVVILSLVVVLVFRFANLDQIPGEIIGDQAERLLAVNDISLGSRPIFSFRNNGSEVLQYYLNAVILKITDSNVTFLMLKTTTAIAGFITVIYMYLLGKEIANKWVGLFSALFFGIAYWPNVLARSSLGSVFVPLFMATLFYYLLKGIRESRINLFLLAGIALGLGLMSYRVFLIAPVIIVLAIVLFCSHTNSIDQRRHAIWGMLIIFLVGLIIYLPLLRVILNNPEAYLFRIFSRLAEWERPYPGNGWVLFAKNLWAAMTMFFWSNGNQWVESVVKRPALDYITAAMFLIGLILKVIQYLRKRHWLDIFLVLSVLVLLMPSVLSIAFPEENPSLSQASGALVPTIVIVGLTLYSLLAMVRNNLPRKISGYVSFALGSILILLSSLQNYDLVFKQYNRNYISSALNTSEIAGVLKQFNETSGPLDNVWILGYPHWVDSKLVAITLNEIDQDFTIWPESIVQTTTKPGAKMFLLNLADDAGKQAILETYPEGTLWEYSSKQAGKNFLVFFVPPSSGDEQ